MSSLLQAVENLLGNRLSLLPEVLHFVEFCKGVRVGRIQQVVVDDRLHLGIRIYIGYDRVDDVIIVWTARSQVDGSCVSFLYVYVYGDDALTVPVVGLCE